MVERVRGRGDGGVGGGGEEGVIEKKRERREGMERKRDWSAREKKREGRESERASVMAKLRVKEQEVGLWQEKH